MNDQIYGGAAMTEYLAGIELGGTTCIVAISCKEKPLTILEKQEFPTLKPEETLKTIIEYLNSVLTKLRCGSYQALAIACFGPVDLNENSVTYGYITSTPKTAWQYFNIVGILRSAFGQEIPIIFETDVNAPAFNEASQCHLTNVAYVTVGTGVGVGVYVNQATIHGRLHPEAGHMLGRRKPGDNYAGCCIFHGDCIEGLISSKALAQRTGVMETQLSSLPDSHDVWQTVGYYLGVLCVNLTLVLSPDVIAFGGGIMRRTIIYKYCRNTFKNLIAGYLDLEIFKTEQGIEEYIRPSIFGNDAGILGALLLAQKATM